MMHAPLFPPILLLLLLALPCAAAAAVPQLVGGQTSAGATSPIQLEDADTDALTYDELPVCLLAIPGAGGRQVIDGTAVSLPVSDSTAQGHLSNVATATAASGAAAPARTIQIGGANGGNLLPFVTDVLGYLWSNAEVYLSGVAAAVDQGVAGTGTQRVKEAQADDNEDGVIAVDQTGDDTYAIPADAYETTCQNQDDADYIMVRAVDAANATHGFKLAPEGGGAGSIYTTRLRGVTLDFYNATQDVAASVYCASETEQ